MAMAISDLSLDDIIKKKYVNVSSNKKGLKNNKIATKKFSKQKQNNIKNINLKSRKPNQVKYSVQKKNTITDARLKIIQKNRQKLNDARDKLAEIAKQGDARSKLDKLRGKNQKQTITITQISKGITLKKGKNGQISLSTNKKQNNALNQRRISNLAHTSFNNPQVAAHLVRRTVNNPLANPLNQSRNRFTPTSNNVFTWNSNSSQTSLQMDQDDFYAQRAIFQQSTKGISTSHIGLQNRLPLRTTSTSPNQQYKQILRPSRIFPNSTMASDWEMQQQQQQQQQQIQKRFRENSSILSVSSWGRMSSELKARLDTPPIQPRTMGILGAQSNQNPQMSSTPIQEPAGYRIVVSNLQLSVTHDDIKELFEDIGPLMSSRMVRNGVAEVIYRNHKDAVKAVDVYHNRQLDGQPMKCMLIKQTSQQQGPLNNNSRNSRLPPGMKMPSKSIQIVPDIDTIHKALFK